MLFPPIIHVKSCNRREQNHNAGETYTLGIAVRIFTSSNFGSICNNIAARLYRTDFLGGTGRYGSFYAGNHCEWEKIQF